MHQSTQNAKRCPRCGGPLSLVPIFTSFAEECRPCIEEGLLPVKTRGVRIGAKGTMAELVKQFGTGFKAKYEYGTVIVRPDAVNLSADTVACTLWTSPISDSPVYVVWPMIDECLLEIIE